MLGGGWPLNGGTDYESYSYTRYTSKYSNVGKETNISRGDIRSIPLTKLKQGPQGSTQPILSQFRRSPHGQPQCPVLSTPSGPGPPSMTQSSGH